MMAAAAAAGKKKKEKIAKNDVAEAEKQGEVKMAALYI